MRSRWKGNYSDDRFDQELLQQKKKNKTYFKLPARNSTILPSFVNRRVAVPVHLRYFNFTIKGFMVGHKFGEYAPTKLMGRAIHARGRKKKKG